MRARFVITGTVQGVGFRAWAVIQARKLQVTGWVRNRSDGAVEAEAEGPADAVNRFRDLLAQGPHGSRVARVTEIPVGHEPMPDPFTTVW